MSSWQAALLQQKKKSETIFKDCTTVHDVYVAKNSLIGKKSPLNLLFSGFSPEKKQKTSPSWNAFKKQIQSSAEAKIQLLISNKNLEQISKDLPSDANHPVYKEIFNFNVENPQTRLLGSPHPLNLIADKIHEFFRKFNFTYEEAPQIEWVNNNFDNLNVGSSHPSRSPSDTFYLNKDLVLRTHATNSTTRRLKDFATKKNETFSYHIGNVFRNDTDDATHNTQFVQLDCCMIGKDLNLAQLKWFLRQFLTFLFGSETKIRFRLSDFPFTQPSIEVDVWSRKKAQWLEVLGGGVIRKQVLKNCLIEDLSVNVLAFGVGIDRLAMILYDFDDIRFLYNNRLVLPT